MIISVIGSGGREHAICKKISESPQVSKIYCIPGNAGTSEIAENIEIDITSLSATPTGSLEMTGARYSGRTPSGNFFSITADRAVEDANNKQTMHLFNPNGTVEREGKGITRLISQEGFYNASADTIELFGAVKVHRDIQNLTLLTERIQANIGAGTLLTSTAVDHIVRK